MKEVFTVRLLGKGREDSEHGMLLLQPLCGLFGKRVDI